MIDYDTPRGTFYPVKQEHFNNDLYMQGKQTTVAIDPETGAQIINIEKADSQ